VIEVILVGEGQTEVTFTDQLLSSYFASRDIAVQPRLINTSQTGRGGALSAQRVIRFLRNTLLERPNTYVSTFFDLYGLPNDFPGVETARTRIDPLQKCSVIEEALKEAVVRAASCRADRLIIHIQPHEFEALLFSDIAAFGSADARWMRFTADLQRARDSVGSPEHINDGSTTHPSARLKMLQPKYRKPLDGSRVAARIGLPRIRSECRHFDAWLGRIEALRPLVAT